MPFELIISAEGLNNCREEWRSLETRVACHVFQSYDFVSSWYTTAGRAAGATPSIVVYREHGEVRAIFPACMVSKSILRLVTWMGGIQIVDYGDVLFDQSSQLGVEDFLKQALQLIRNSVNHHICYFPYVRSDATIYPYLSKNFLVNDSDVAPCAYLQGGFEDFLDSLKRFRKKLKSDTLRQEKRLAALGELQFLILDQSDDRMDTVMTAFLKQKRDRYLASGVAGVLFVPGYEEFYRRQPHDNSSVHVSALLLDDQVIAAHVGYVYGSTFYYLMPSYAPEFEKYSPGRVLMLRLVEECFRLGLTKFDLGRGNEGYKYEWTDRETALRTFVSPGLKGALFNQLYRLRAWYRRSG